jgi:hypothetical protein
MFLTKGKAAAFVPAGYLINQRQAYGTYTTNSAHGACTVNSGIGTVCHSKDYIW